MYKYTKELHRRIKELEQEAGYSEQIKDDMLKKIYELRDDKSDLLELKDSLKLLKKKESQFNSAIYENQILKSLVETLKETIINLSCKGRK